MGILNVTPDSFSDGGRFLDVERAVDHAFALAADGADLIDIGGESSRPGARPVEPSEELRRVLPVLERLKGKLPLPLSVDTRKPEVAREALWAGAAMVNHIEAARTEHRMLEVIAETGAGYLAMHMQGDPETMQDHPQYDDVVAEIDGFFGSCLASMDAAGIDRRHVALDPGIGFGKTVHQNLRLMACLARYTKHNRPLVLGVSRKSFLGRVAGGEPPQRVAAGLACSLWGFQQGVTVFRTHDVRDTVQALRMWSGIAEEASETQ